MRYTLDLVIRMSVAQSYKQHQLKCGTAHSESPEVKEPKDLCRGPSVDKGFRLKILAGSIPIQKGVAEEIAGWPI